MTTFFLKLELAEQITKSIWLIDTQSTPIPSLRLLSGGKDLAYTSDFPSKTFGIWDLNTGNCLYVYSYPDEHYSFVMPNGLLISYNMSDETTIAWYPSTGMPSCNMEKVGKPICVIELPDEKLASCNSFKSDIIIWDIKDVNKRKYDKENVRDWDLKCQKVFNSQGQSTVFIALLNNRNLVSVDKNCSIKVWDINTYECLRTFDTGLNKPDICTIMENNQVVICNYEKNLKIIDTQTGQSLVYQRPSIIESFDCIIGITSLGEKCIIQYGKSFVVWDGKKNTYLILNHEANISCITTLLKEFIVSGSYDKTVKVWDANTGKCLFTLPHFNAVTQSMTSFKLDSAVTQVFDLSNGQLVTERTDFYLLQDSHIRKASSTLPDSYGVKKVLQLDDGRELTTIKTFTTWKLFKPFELPSEKLADLDIKTIVSSPSFTNK